MHKTILLTDIDATTLNTSCWNATLHSPIIESIKTVGIINAPTAIIYNNKLTLASGFKRFHATQHLKVTHMIINVSNELTAETAIQSQLMENASFRLVNPLEISQLIFVAQKQLHYSISDIQNNFFPTLKLASTFANFEKYAELINLPKIIQEKIITQPHYLKLIPQIQEFKPKDVLVILSIIDQLKLNVNQATTFLELMLDIMTSDQLSLTELLANKPFFTILHNHELDTSEQSKKMKAALFSHRYPEIAAQQAKLKQHLQLLATHNVHLDYASNFEQKKICLTLWLSHPEQKCEIKQTLDHLFSSPELDALLNIL